MCILRGAPLVIAFALVACASEEERYQWNVTHVYLTPQARQRLSRSDLDEVARLIAHETPKRIMAISGVPKEDHRGILSVTVGLPNGSSPSDFGTCIIDKQNGTWRITKKYDGLSASLVGFGFSDPPR
ncbi:MAG TPA: hypothetical protein VEI58_09250 [Chthoniobacterales bacterium]|nr:hypothetical protein [Chthoniobacterales bacterium]